MRDFEKNTIVPCVDWFRAIIPVVDVRRFIDDLGKIDSRLSFEHWIKTDLTMLNYSQRWVLDSIKSFTFAFNPEDGRVLQAKTSSECSNPFVLFSLSGDAIRFLGSDSLKNLLQYFSGLEYSGIKTKCTRIDIALDFFNPDNNIVPLFLDCCSHFIKPVKGEPCLLTSYKRDPKNFRIHTNVYPSTGEITFGYDIGHHGSTHGMFRIYDKKFESLYGRNRTRGKELLAGRDYWYRAELELHNNPKNRLWANEAFYNLVYSDWNIYGVIGVALDELFILCDKARSVNSRLGKSEVSVLWVDFISWLSSSIHFVQLVSEKFVDDSEEKLWRELERTSALLYVREMLKKSNPSRYREIYHKGRDKLLDASKPQYKIKYGAVLDNIKLTGTFHPYQLHL